MKERLSECRKTAEELVTILLAVVEKLQTDEKTHELVEQVMARAVALRSDLRRLERYADALDTPD